MFSRAHLCNSKDERRKLRADYTSQLSFYLGNFDLHLFRDINKVPDTTRSIYSHPERDNKEGDIAPNNELPVININTTKRCQSTVVRTRGKLEPLTFDNQSKRSSLDRTESRQVVARTRPLQCMEGDLLRLPYRRLIQQSR